jgi:hypothetical protein
LLFLMSLSPRLPGDLSLFPQSIHPPPAFPKDPRKRVRAFS